MESFELSGWNSPRPVTVRLSSHDHLDRLTQIVQTEAALLVPRIEQLEQRVGDAIFQKRGYQASKTASAFDLTVTRAPRPELPPAAANPHRSATPQFRLHALPRDDSALAAALGKPGPVLMLGMPRAGGPIAAALAGVADRLTHLQPTEETSPEQRMSAASWPAWLSFSTDAERADVGTVVFGTDAAADSIAHVRTWIAPGAHVVAELGTVAASWLYATWSGMLVEGHGVLVGSGHGAQSIPETIEWPRISVVTISFNQAQFLERCLRSVLDQGYPNLEYIVIDGGSTDGSRGILHRYRSQISYQSSEPDDGQSDALNKGFAKATGEIFTWINSDDCLASDALFKVARAFHTHGTDIVAGTCLRIDETDVTRFRHFSALPLERPVPFAPEGPLQWSREWERGHFFFQPEVFFSRGIWERAGAFFHLHHYWAMDWDLWLRFALRRGDDRPDPGGARNESRTRRSEDHERGIVSAAGCQHPARFRAGVRCRRRGLARSRLSRRLSTPRTTSPQ